MKKSSILLAAIAAATSVNAAVQTIDFNTLEHGRIVNNQYAAQGLLSVTVTNFGSGPDIAVAFDTNLNNTYDADLQRTVSAADKSTGLDKNIAKKDINNAGWDFGNVPSSTDFGKVLIIQENSVGLGDGIADSPDDDVGGGYFLFQFAMPIYSFGFDLLDIEKEILGSSFVKFFDGLGGSAQIAFNTLAGRDGAIWGNNSANAIAPFTAAEVGLNHFTQVKIQLGGSGAIDNLRYNVPDAANTMTLLGAALIGLAAIRRRCRK